MSTFKLKIETDNAAFEDRGYELSRILTALARKAEVEMDDGANSGVVMDVNGNKVGEWKLTAAQRGA